jgi:hypothetical protein
MWHADRHAASDGAVGPAGAVAATSAAVGAAHV